MAVLGRRHEFDEKVADATDPRGAHGLVLLPVSPGSFPDSIFPVKFILAARQIC
jgi:hypothetical protein